MFCSLPAVFPVQGQITFLLELNCLTVNCLETDRDHLAQTVLAVLATEREKKKKHQCWIQTD